MDPAGPGFEIITIQTKHLERNDAQFVDIIHTAGGLFGYMSSIGDVDFFPNGGVAIQPGCEHFISNNIQENFISNI